MSVSDASLRILEFACSIRGIHKKQLDLLIEAAFYQTDEEKQAEIIPRPIGEQEFLAEMKALDDIEKAIKEAIAALI